MIFEDLLNISENVEKSYLNNFENTLAHFIGTIGENIYSEVTLGKTHGQTKEICMGYTESPVCRPLLEMADEKSMDLDFWYVVA